MNVTKVNNTLIIQNYSQVAFVTDASNVKDNSEIHDFIKNKILVYFSNNSMSETGIFNFVDYKKIKFLYDAVKVALWKGIVEQPFLAYNDNELTDLILKIDSDFNVRILKFIDEEQGTYEEIIQPYSIDTLELIDSDFMKNYEASLTDSDKEELEERAKSIRELLNPGIMVNLTDSDLCVIVAEDMSDLIF